MAVTISHLASGVQGAHRWISVIATPSAGDLETWTTGLNNLVGVGHALGSAVSGGVRIQLNQLSAATASPGTLCIRSASAGDEIFLTVYGN